MTTVISRPRSRVASSCIVVPMSRSSTSPSRTSAAAACGNGVLVGVRSGRHLGKGRLGRGPAPGTAAHPADSALPGQVSQVAPHGRLADAQRGGQVRSPRPHRRSAASRGCGRSDAPPARPHSISQLCDQLLPIMSRLDQTAWGGGGRPHDRTSRVTQARGGRSTSSSVGRSSSTSSSRACSARRAAATRSGPTAWAPAPVGWPTWRSRAPGSVCGPRSRPPSAATCTATTAGPCSRRPKASTCRTRRRFEGWHTPVTVSLAFDDDRAMVTHGHPAPGELDDLLIERAARHGCASSTPARRVRPGSTASSRPAAWSSPTSAGTPPARGTSTGCGSSWPGCTRSCPTRPRRWPTPAPTRPGAALEVLRDCVPLAVVTTGSGGAFAADAETGETAWVPAVSVEVLDPTGAGDVFLAGLMVGHPARLAAAAAAALRQPVCRPVRARLRWRPRRSRLGRGRQHGGPSTATHARVRPRLRLPRRRDPRGHAARGLAGRGHDRTSAPARPTAATTPEGAHHEDEIALPAALAAARRRAPCCRWRPAPPARTPTAARNRSTRSDVETDVAGVGDVTLTVWDQEVRGGQDKPMRGAQRGVHGAVPERDDRAGVAVLRRPAEAGAAGDHRRRRTGRRPGQQRPGRHGRVRQGRPAASARRLRRRLRLGRALPGVGALGRVVQRGRRRPSARATCTAFRSPASWSASGTTRPSSTQLGIERAADLDGLRGRPSRRGQAGRRDPDPVRQPRPVAGHPHFGLRAEPHSCRGTRSGSSASASPAPRGRPRDNQARRRRRSPTGSTSGYFTEGFNGLGYDPAWQDFAKGNGVFLVSGTWLQADLEAGLGDDSASCCRRSVRAGELAVTGSTGLPFSITDAAEREPDVAAAYLDFITSPDAMAKISEAGSLPRLRHRSRSRPTGRRPTCSRHGTPSARHDALTPVPRLGHAGRRPTVVPTEVQELMGGDTTTPTSSSARSRTTTRRSSSDAMS